MKKIYQIYCRCEANCVKHIEAENFGEALKLAQNKLYPIDPETVGQIGKCGVDKVKSYFQLHKDTQVQSQEENNYPQRLYLE